MADEGGPWNQSAISPKAVQTFLKHTVWRGSEDGTDHQSHQVSGPGPTIQGQSMGIAGEEDSCPWVLGSN